MILPVVGVIVHTLRHAALERFGRMIAAATRRPRRLRIGVDIRPFYEPLTGVGWYLHHLLHHLAAREDVELLLFGDARLTEEGPHLHTELPAGARLCVFDLRGMPPSRLARPLTAAAYVLWMWLLKPDLIFGANYFLPRLMGAVARRRVVTVHDLTYKRYPSLLQQETLHNLERQMQREIALADAVICVSLSTRQDLLHYYDADPARVVAIHSGLPPLPAPAEVDGLPDRYILFVSTIEPRKNLDTLLDAYARLRSEHRYDGALLIAGRVGWKAQRTAARLKEPGVVHLDYVQAAQLRTLYGKAELFVFPSLYEGFGFPLLEAMAQGVPVVAARSSSLPEIGGDAALYFDPSSSDELLRAMREALHDQELRRQLVERGLVQSAKFQWERTAAETLQLFREVAGRGQ